MNEGRAIVKGGELSPTDSGTTGEIEQPFFSVNGLLVKVNGEDVQVFEFADAAAADAEASRVVADGGSIGKSMVSWIAPPHFCKAGELIVL